MNSELPALLPHGQEMVLLDGILGLDDTSLTAEVVIRESSQFYRPTGDPLCEGQAGVPAWVGVEYMAQAVAAWSGAREKKAQNGPKIGFLLAVKEYSCSHPLFPLGSRLTVTVRARDQHGSLKIFAGEIEGAELIASAVISVFEGEPPRRGSS